ncbi:MAG: SdrD B-like domain-containing protein [Acidobacteriota bacterium]
MKRCYLCAMAMLLCLLALPGFTRAQTGSISGMFFIDTNDDRRYNGGTGSQDGDLLLKNGAIVKLYHRQGQTYNKIDSTTTDADGRYAFHNLEDANNYYVKFFIPADKQNDYEFLLHENGDLEVGYSDIASEDGYTDAIHVSNSNNHQVYDIDGALKPKQTPPQLGSITGNVWEGNNKNGIKELGEDSPVKDVVVKAYRCDQNNTYAGQGNTNGNGTYTIASLPAGFSYKVVFEPPAGYYLVDKGTDSAPDSSNKTTECSATTLTASGLVFNAGVYKPTSGGNPNGQINGRLWLDADKDGAQGGTGPEPGIEDWTVRLLDSHKITIDSTTTKISNAGGQKGTYSFTNLNLGTYYIQFVKKGDYLFTDKDAANNDESDSDVNPATGITDSIVIDHSDASEEHIDAGVYLNEPPAKGSIGDLVWNDENKNGLQDESGNSGIPGVKVILYSRINNSDSKLDSTTTNGSGKYKFDNLSAGSYRVRFFLTSGYDHFTTKGTNLDDGNNSDAEAIDPATLGFTAPFNLAAGEDRENVDAGMIAEEIPPAKGSIGDYVWNDENGNGLQDESGNPGIKDVKVMLYSHTENGDVKLDSTTTNGSGHYKFDQLLAGTYRIRFFLISGYDHFTTKGTNLDDGNNSDADAQGYTIPFNLAAGENRENVDAGMIAEEIPPAKKSIGDFVWFDENKNGIQDDDEFGVPNVTVLLYLSNDDNTSIAQRTTDYHGRYLFSNLDPGTYRLRFIRPYGYSSFTVMGAGNNTNLDSDVNPLDGFTGTVTLSASSNRLDIDAGLIKKSVEKTCIGDFVWKDCNSNGIQDKDEPGIPNVRVELYKWDGNAPLKWTTTNSAGKYYFENVEPGSYYVKFMPAAGMKFTLKDQGSNDALDSDADTKTGKTDKITLNGENNFTIDAGMVTDLSLLTNLGDLVWNDCNRNGIQDVGETGIGGVELKLHICTSSHTNPNDPCACGNVVATTKTDKNGKYMFTNILPGYYCIEIVVPCNFTITLPDKAEDFKDSDIIPSMKHTACIKLNPGETNLSVDAGLYPTPPAAIGDFVWIDANKNGIQDKGEKGLCNVMVELYMCGVTKPVAATKTDNDGKYLFRDLTPNTSYSVKFYLPKGYAFTLTDQGGNDNFDSDACPRNNGMTKFYDVIPDETNMSVDAGMYLATTSPCNYVWKDNNNNGLKDNGEAGIQGVTVELYQCSNNTLVQSVKTDATGLFTFKDILLESYYLRIIVPDGYKIGKASPEGNTPGVNADFGTNGQSTCFDVTGGTTSIGKPIALVLSTTGITRGVETPTEFTLQQNYPNPFNPSTTIEFAVPAAGQYTLKVFNMLGQEVATLLQRELTVGYHMVTFDASGLTSGMYIYRLCGNNVVMTKKMILSK